MNQNTLYPEGCYVERNEIINILKYIKKKHHCYPIRKIKLCK